MLLAALTLAALTLCPGDAFDKAKDKVLTRTANDLISVAKWCADEGYGLERDRMYGLVLGLDADNKKARHALMYVKGESGEWVQSEEFAPSRNSGRVDFDELEEREEKVWGRWAKSLVACIEEHEDDLTAAERERELRVILARFPDHAKVRRELGYVEGWDGKPWVTPGAKRAHERRRQIKAFAKDRREQASKPGAVELEDYERECGVEWAGAMESRAGRVLTSAGAQEAELALELIEAAPAFLADVFGNAPSLPAGMRAYLVEGQDPLPRLVAAIPGARGPSVKGVGSWWTRGNVLLVGTSSRAGRLDMVSSQVIHHLLRDSFGISGEQGWAYEGFSIYLSHKLCGTRLSYSVQPSEYVEQDKSTGQRMRANGASWLRMGHEILSGEKPPNLVFVFGKDINQLTDVDLMIGYGLAAYLLEAHADKAPEILRRLGKEPAVTVLEDVLGTKIDRLRTELAEWLGEMS
ncbi:MAG: hypothetical protein O2816_03250 [Planctomycetota bacterium]|nr:hypothetical protein [Planctomycetota bacterium]